MALQFSRTDITTGHQFTVYARIDKANVILGDQTQITLNLYDSIGAAQSQLTPVLPPDTVVMLPEELSGINAAFVTGLSAAVQAGRVLSPLDALKAALYTLLKARPAYAGSVDV